MKIRGNLRLALSAVILLWLVYLLDFFLPLDLRFYGLRPRHPDGLWGILSAPLLHANLNHLIANTGALFILLTVSLSFSRKLTYTAVLITWLAGGGLVWLFGKGPAIHIGASGIIFGLIGFLMFIGFFRRERVALIVSLVIIFFYSGALHSLTARIPGISWTSHFFGFLSGGFAAWLTKNKRSK